MPWALSVGVADAGPALRRLMTRAGSAESRAPARDRRAGGGAGVGVFGADTEAEGERTGQTHSPGPALSATPSTSAICPSHTPPPPPPSSRAAVMDKGLCQAMPGLAMLPRPISEERWILYDQMFKTYKSASNEGKKDLSSHCFVPSIFVIHDG